MRVGEIMTEDVLTVAPDEAVAAARTLMRARGIHHLVVVDERRRVIGVVSAGDVGGRRAPVSDDRRIGEVMSTPVVCVERDTTVRRAANVLRGHTIGCLPVLEDGRLAGILTLSDLLELLGRGSFRPTPQSERTTKRVRRVERRPPTLRG